MEERVKLQRICIAPEQYTTGDAQEWTYEYTWEDFYAMHNKFSLPLGQTPYSKIRTAILDYFAEHPEKLIEEGPFKDYKLEDFIRMCREVGLAVFVMSRIEAIKKA